MLITRCVFAVAIGDERVVGRALARVRAERVRALLVALVPHLALVEVDARALVGRVDNLSARAVADAAARRRPASVQTRQRRTLIRCCCCL